MKETLRKLENLFILLFDNFLFFYLHSPIEKVLVSRLTPFLVLNHHNYHHFVNLRPHPVLPLLHYLPITLRYSFQFVLLLDSITITAPLRSIYQLFSQTLRHALDVPERSFSSPDRQ